MQVGDHVRIVSSDHPWNGSTGTITERKRIAHLNLDFVMELDHGDYPGQGCFVGRGDIVSSEEARA